MPQHEMESGRVEYGPRAFHQDASSAMHGDIIRGLIELITNSDDAYAAAGGCTTRNPGRITIEVEHRRGQPWRVVVRDRATGMRRETMIRRLTFLGGRTSGFETGQDRRGNLGRGAKDLAYFGDTTFTSICDGHLSTLVLHSDGTYLVSKRESKPTEEERTELGIRHNGTVVLVEVRAGITCPQHVNLKRKLSTHYQLRDILSDPTRRVELVNLNQLGKGDPLNYTYPDLDVVFEGELVIPGYDEVPAHLIIWRHPARFEEGLDDPGRPNGILIKGGRAIYENTLFAFEGNINASWFSGKLDCPYIDVLARAFDDRDEQHLTPDATNPMPIISRQRDGLEKDHPFVRALREAAEKPLGRLAKEEADRVRQKSDQSENAETRKALDKLGREFGRLLDEEMKEIEAEEPTGGGVGEPPLLDIVPKQAYAYMGEDRTLTIHARAEGLAAGDKVIINVEPRGVVEVLTPEVELRVHPRRDDVLSGQLRLRPLLEGEAVLITGDIGSRSDSAYVEVRQARDVEPVEVEIPDTLEFEKTNYRIGWQRHKRIGIQAPAEVVAEYGQTVRVVSSDPEDVVVRGGKTRLEFDEDLDYYTGTIEVEARTLHTKAHLSARLGDLKATTQVTVTRKEGGPSYIIKLVPTSWGIFRAIVESETTDAGHEVQVIKIAAHHPAIKPYIGENYEGQNSYVCRTIIAEVVADIAARMVVTELFNKRKSSEEFDALILYREHYKRMQRILPRFYRVLVGDPRQAQAAALADPSPIVERAASWTSESVDARTKPEATFGETAQLPLG